MRIKQMNKLAYEELVLSIDMTDSLGKVAFQLVKTSKTADYASGHAPTAWKCLVNKYAPKLTPRKLELKVEFQ